MDSKREKQEKEREELKKERGEKGKGKKEKGIPFPIDQFLELLVQPLVYEYLEVFVC